METIFDSEGNEAVYFENRKCKIVEAKDGSFHHLFVKENGFSMVYGKTRDDDPDYSSFGPLIADIEITTICHGPRNKEGKRVPCSFCYKANTPNGTYMSLDTFKEVFSKLGVLTEIEIETEDGILYFKPYDDVKTKNGVKKAKDLTFEDELA